MTTKQTCPRCGKETDQPLHTCTKQTAEQIAERCSNEVMRRAVVAMDEGEPFTDEQCNAIILSAITEATAAKDKEIAEKDKLLKILESNCSTGDCNACCACCDKALARAEQAEAQCAVMREALEHCKIMSPLDPFERGAMIDKALSTTCGKELLEEVKSLRADKERLLTAAINLCEYRFTEELVDCMERHFKPVVEDLRTAIDHAMKGMK